MAEVKSSAKPRRRSRSLNAAAPVIAVPHESASRSSRRKVLAGFAGLSLAALLADPRKVAQATAGLQTVTIKTASGHQVSGALALPERTPKGGVMIVH